MIIRARGIVTMDGPPIEDGAVVVAGNQIVDVGKWRDVRGRNAGDALDLGEHTLLPGLINAHCHLDYTLLRGTIAPQRSFTSWISEINARKASLQPADYLRSIANGFDEAASFGTTTLANLEAFPELLASMPPPLLRTWWFAELIDVRAPVSATAAHNTMAAAFRDGEWRGGLGIAPHAPFTASASLYAEAAEIGAQRSLRLTTHLAESRDEMEMFRDGRGALFDFMKSIRRPMHDCGRATPFSVLRGLNVLDERWIVAHLNELTQEDLRLLTTGPKFHVVHCPRSHAYFDHAHFRFAELRALGFNICLGTDSLASNDDLSLFAEMRQFARAEPTLSARELLELVTVNAAAALGQHDSLGKISGGFSADLIAVPWHGKLDEIVDAVVFHDEKISWLMLDGAVQNAA